MRYGGDEIEEVSESRSGNASSTDENSHSIVIYMCSVGP